MSSEDGLKKIAEYNAKAAAQMYSNEDQKIIYDKTENGYEYVEDTGLESNIG